MLSLLTLLSNIFLVVLFIAWIFKKFLQDPRLLNSIIALFGQRLTLSAFIVALTAMLGSLYFSEVSGFAPCKLCWFQRVFMYPLPFILLVAQITIDKKIWKYILPLSLTGVLFSSYHYYLQRAANPLSPCSTIGFSVSCSDRFFMHYNYITIPWMALSAFVLITIAMYLLRLNKTK